MQKIYLVPGLGADERVFQKLQLNTVCQHVTWIPPYLNEPVKNYCQRLAESNKLQPNQILIGVSFGGMIALELARITHAHQTIIISSVKSRQEIPWQFRWAGRLKIHQLLPYSLLKKPNSLLRYYFGPISGSDYQLLKDIIRQTDVQFLKWAIDTIVNWQPQAPIPELIHIHGTKDRLFKSHRLQNYIPIQDGGHFMILNRAGEVSQIIKQHIRDA